MNLDQLILPTFTPDAGRLLSTADFLEELRNFRQFGKASLEEEIRAPQESRESIHLPVLTNEFWTSKQRAAHSLHEISYRACFKPQLPRFFLERLTRRGDMVYDPFMGRGTTLLEAALHGRIPAGCDINPLSSLLVRPRLHPPSLREIEQRLTALKTPQTDEFPPELLVFFHPETLEQICAFKRYFLEREEAGDLDPVDDWLRMVCLNRLTGHSKGFFSVYTLPPNQAVSVQRQEKINAARNQSPPPRDVREILWRKSKSLLADCTPETAGVLRQIAPAAKLFTGPADSPNLLPSATIDLVVTSPPFLDVVDYSGDNWLRCWFLGIDSKQVRITKLPKPEEWQSAMQQVFQELHRLLKPGGWVAFEVGEVRKGSLKLEELIIPCGIKAGLSPALVLINSQEFTKTANCWGISNMAVGTNTNRVALFRKPE
jgi:hypothetical protein